MLCFKMIITCVLLNSQKIKLASLTFSFKVVWQTPFKTFNGRIQIMPCVKTQIHFAKDFQ